MMCGMRAVELLCLEMFSIGSPLSGYATSRLATDLRYQLKPLARAIPLVPVMLQHGPAATLNESAPDGGTGSRESLKAAALAGPTTRPIRAEAAATCWLVDGDAAPEAEDTRRAAARPIRLCHLLLWDIAAAAQYRIGGPGLYRRHVRGSRTPIE